jgi:hypothetical protein
VNNKAIRYWLLAIREPKDGEPMEDGGSAPNGRRGITVLALLLLIIAAIVAAIFLVRYLRTRPAVSSTPAITSSVV